METVLAPDAIAIDMVATAVFEGFATTKPGERQHEALGERQPVGRSQYRSGVVRIDFFDQIIQSACTRMVKHEPIDQAGTQARLQTLPPGFGVVGSVYQALCRQPARSHRIAQPESCQRVLKPRVLADHRFFALHRCAWQSDISETVEAVRILYLQPGVEFEIRYRRRKMLRLVAKACEDSTCHRSASFVHEQVGVALRGQLRPERKPGTIGHGRVKNLADRDDIGTAWAA